MIHERSVYDEYEILDDIPGTEKEEEFFSSVLSYGESIDTGESVVIKQIFLNEGFERKQIAFENLFHQELRLMRLLNDLPFTVDLIDYFVDEMEITFVLEKVEGLTVKEYVQRHHPIPLHEGLNIGTNIAYAYRNIHDRGIIHRDLSDNNIFILSDGHVKIIDFGLAYHQRRGVLMKAGTDVFPPPEAHFLRERPKKTYDIFSFGVLLYKLFYKKNPFVVGEILQRKKVDPDFSERKIPKRLESLILQCLQYDPKKRPQNMQQIYGQLKKLGEKIEHNDCGRSNHGKNDSHR